MKKCICFFIVLLLAAGIFPVHTAAAGYYVYQPGTPEFLAARMSLARSIEKSAGGKSYACRLAVGAVAVNRMKSRYFPDSIYDVLRECYAYLPDISSAAPDRRSLAAARDALLGLDPTFGAVFAFPAGSPETEEAKTSLVLDGIAFALR